MLCLSFVLVKLFIFYIVLARSFKMALKSFNVVLKCNDVICVFV